MKFDFKKLIILCEISLRSLLRQRRRNLLLGVAIAFGMMILVIAYSFSHGIADNLFNRVIVWATGHIEVAVMEKGKFQSSTIRDKERIVNIINKTVKDIRFIDEAIGVFTRALGNGRAENIVLVGIDYHTPQDKGQGNWEVIEGSEKDMTNGKYEFPLILYGDKAKDLNVKVGDTVRVRLETIYGQEQSARFTVVALGKSEGMFQSLVIFTTLPVLKSLLGFKPHESGSLQIILKNPKKDAFKYANELHDALKPNIAYIYGDLINRNNKIKVFTWAYNNNPLSIQVLTNHVKLTKNEWKTILPKEKVLISENTAKEAGLKIGDTVKISYRTKFNNNQIINKYTIAGFFKSDSLPPNSILTHENIFFKTYYPNLPAPYSEEEKLLTSLAKKPIAPALVKEWVLFGRTYTHDAMEKKYAALTRQRYKGAAMDVRTMYEMASQIIQLENALNIITLAAVLILFFIILIGVVNTMRMSIRERTREIGTMRAIGMQKNDIKNIFILENLFLSFAACFAGMIAAFIIIFLLSLITFNTTSPLNIFLVKKHLYFVPTFMGMFFNFLMILIISAVTSYFPAKRASNLPPAGALRHYE